MNSIARQLGFLLSPLAVVSLYAGTPAGESGAGFRRRALEVVAPGKTGFTALSAAETGLVFTNVITAERVAKHYNTVSGGGVAAGDYDGDGLCDLYFCNRGGENALFRNLGGGRFQNVTNEAGVGNAGRSSVGATFADINGDGRPDLLVTSFFGPNTCFVNLGDGRFANVTERAGLPARGGVTSLALGDVDGDRDLDLYIGYFGIESILREGGRLSFRMMNGQPVVTGRHARRLKIEAGQLVELGEQDTLSLNDGQGHFTPVTWAEWFRDEAGQPVAAAPLDFGLSVQVRDINEDGFPDIYTTSDFQTPDRLWLNDGHGHFHALPVLAVRTMSYASMGVDFADIDRDGRLDFITVDMFSRDHFHRMRQASSMPMTRRRIGVIEDREAVPRNALFWNRGDGTYAEIAWLSGLEASDWSWTPIFLDVDLDGYEDLLVSTGSLYDVMDRDAAAAAARLSSAGGADSRTLLTLYPPLDSRNAAFRNRGDLTFEDVSALWQFDSRAIAQGMALTDLDGDGDLDVVINCANAPPLVCRNDTPAPRVAVRLKGLPPNTQGIGAKISLFGGAVPRQSQEMICGGRYLSGDEPMRVFAAGRLTNALSIEVLWPGGKRSLIQPVFVNQLYEIDEFGASTPAARLLAQSGAQEPARSATPGGVLFEDVGALLNHTHQEEEFNDFERQPLLPRKLSQSGPGVAWQDVDEDGWDDLIVSSGKGGKLAVVRNDQRGGFRPWRGESWDQSVTRDQTGIVGIGFWFLAGSANYEDAMRSGPCAQEYQAGSPAKTGLPGGESSTGPLALTDFDGDGQLDLFVGGLVIPGRYPEAADSLFFHHRQGRWELDEENTRQLARVGLVSGAVWSDLDGDGFPELILASQWGPMRLFRNEGGQLRAWNPSLRGASVANFQELTGWWNGVTTGDFDGDGRMDVVASNWGWNSNSRATRERPCRIYFGDIAGNGRIDLLEAGYDELMKAEVPARDLDAVALALPFVRGKFGTHAAYGQASVSEILGASFRSVNAVAAISLNSTVFLNRGGAFEAVVLPVEAQFSPAFSVCVGDADGNGTEDIFLSQNFFATRPEDARLAAGRGLWLAGDGHGSFRPLEGQDSGVRVYGEQRGAALSDYDQDGRTDLVVTQNGSATKLYRNVAAKPGVRIRLAGPGENRTGLGAQVWLENDEWRGPAREIHAGSGYWSQDSAVQVVSPSRPASRIWVRWPGGKVTKTQLPRGAKEIRVDHTGAITALR